MRQFRVEWGESGHMFWSGICEGCAAVDKELSK